MFHHLHRTVNIQIDLWWPCNEVSCIRGRLMEFCGTRQQAARKILHLLAWAQRWHESLCCWYLRWIYVYWRKNKISQCEGKKISSSFCLIMVNLYGVVISRRKNQFAGCERKTNHPLALTWTWLIFIHVDCGGRIILGGKLISIFWYSMRQSIRLWSDIEDDEPDSDRIRTLSAAAPTLREQMTSWSPFWSLSWSTCPHRMR